jgi:hypothetical protein
MTAALAHRVDRIERPAEPGVCVRACRVVLRILARIAGPDGEFRWGCRVSKLVILCEVSISPIRRAERSLLPTASSSARRSVVAAHLRAGASFLIALVVLRNRPLHPDSGPAHRPLSAAQEALSLSA